jgi:O-methyltransferase involved in polyketide biosynthesis
MTILEGVLLYLSPEAIDATFACIAGYSAPGSPVALTYKETGFLSGASAEDDVRRRFAGLLGEPMRSGFEPDTLGRWLDVRGFHLVRDEGGRRATDRLLPGHGDLATGGDYIRSHFALARRA